MLGLTKLDAVLGTSEKRPSHTLTYGEEASERSNEEMRQLRESFMISVVVPLYNEEETIPLLLSRIRQAVKSWGTYEIIFVDDGSSDKTREMLKVATEADKNLKLLCFSRNFGHQAAVSAGLANAHGDAVVVMDGDLQDPPELIDEMIAKWQDGAMVVYAVRKQRKENFVKRFLYALFYRLFKRLARIDVPLDAGDFSLMDRKVVDIIVALPEKNRFIRGLRSWAGFTSVGISYERQERALGESKYTLWKLFHLAFDGFTGFSTAPLKVSVYIGFFMAVVSFIIGVFIIILKLSIGIDVAGWTSLALIVFFMGGVQLFLMGVMGEYIGRIYTEVQNRPIYIIKEKIGFD